MIGRGLEAIHDAWHRVRYGSRVYGLTWTVRRGLTGYYAIAPLGSPNRTLLTPVAATPAGAAANALEADPHAAIMVRRLGTLRL